MNKKKIQLNIKDSSYGARFWFATHYEAILSKHDDPHVVDWVPDQDIVSQFGTHIIMTPFDSTVIPEAVLHHIQHLNQEKDVTLAYSGDMARCHYCNNHFKELASGDPLASETSVLLWKM